MVSNWQKPIGIVNPITTCTKQRMRVWIQNDQYSSQMASTSGMNFLSETHMQDCMF
jgi:hypothetical protein